MFLNDNVCPAIVNNLFVTLISVSHYTHVGTKFSISNDLRHEVSSRAAIIRAGSGVVRKNIADPVLLKGTHLLLFFSAPHGVLSLMSCMLNT